MLRLKSPERRTFLLQLDPGVQTALWGSRAIVSALLWCLFLSPADSCHPREGEAPRTREAVPLLPLLSPVNSAMPFLPAGKGLKGGGVIRGVPDSRRKEVSPDWGLSKES